MSASKILLVDDEPNIIELARMYLEKEGYEIVTATDGEQALTRIEQDKPDLIVLDLMLPRVDGWQVCRRTRAESDVPILMLTARDDDIDKIVGLELGADDYMTKPFNPRELVARIKAILRRVSGSRREEDEGRSALRIGNVHIDPARHEASVDGERLSLRAKEFDLLYTLMDNKGMVLSREQLLSLVWGFDFYGQTRTVDVHVAHVRARLEAAEANLRIETVWGVGYKLME